MPKKLNFLGGQQNYDAENGQYLPDLTNKDGEPVKGFSSFKKREPSYDKNDEKFNQAYEKYKKMGYRTDDARMMAYRDSRDTSEDDRLNAIIEERIKQGYDQKGTYDPDAIKDLGYLGFGSLTALEENTFGKKTSFDTYNDKRTGKESTALSKQIEENKPTNEELTSQDNSVGKIAKYSPFMRQADGSWKKDDTQQKRIKTLHNGLGIETKAQSKEHFYHEQVGKYRLVDIETGTTVGWAKDFDDAIKKSQDQDFIGAINRAKKVFFEKHPELKEQSSEVVDYNAKRLGK